MPFSLPQSSQEGKCYNCGPDVLCNDNMKFSSPLESANSVSMNTI